MSRNSFETFIENISASWAPLSSELVSACSAHTSELLRSPVSEDWLADLHREASAYTELYRSAEHGFVQLAHTEPEGLYRQPHDHGRGWVIYGLQSGAIEMGTYFRSPLADGTFSLVKRDSTLLRAGDVKVFLPGDIHDTKCVAGPALLFRFADRDLKQERVKRYLQDGVDWIESRS